MNGNATFYLRDGVIRKAFYRNLQEVGEVTLMLPDGSIRRGEYNNNHVPIGTHITETKQGKEICHYEKGVLEGEKIFYNKEGNIIKKMVYKRGIFINKFVWVLI